ncbi:CinA family protein [uncultured Legionella sp.]|uniref:CinA family protein n=1 Tax=uncultured Legionella sp. TaxID=210934 RepID=UPI00261D9ACA|nr:CinA family protein [uncultured Legionella sp.]
MTHFTLLIKELAFQLQNTRQQLVTAESCTGGLISAYLTEVPGSSAWFERGFVTYSNLAKQEMLSVPEELLRQFGAVSEEVALAMATGALQHSAGHIAVSVTGIAGPDGGSIDKPVGTVCFGWAVRDTQHQTLRKQFNGTRQEIRVAACEVALRGVLSLIRP